MVAAPSDTTANAEVPGEVTRQRIEQVEVEAVRRDIGAPLRRGHRVFFGRVDVRWAPEGEWGLSNLRITAAGVIAIGEAKPGLVVDFRAEQREVSGLMIS